MDQLRELLDQIPKNQWNRSVKKNHNYVNYLKQRYPFTASLNEQLYLFNLHLDSPPICPVTGCNNSVNWINNDHYSITCGYSCSQSYKKQTNRLCAIQQRMKQTMLERYGVENPSQNAKIVEKRHRTMMEKHGALVSPATRESARNRANNLNTKGRQTLKERYGVQNPGQLPDHNERVKDTLINRYGVDHISKIPAVKSVREKRLIDRYQSLVGSIVTILEWNEPLQYLKDVYETPNDRIKFKCESCDAIEELPTETYKFRYKVAGTPCIKCSQINHGSIQERQLREYVESLGISVVANDRKEIHPAELDIWIPSRRIGIEYCGLYWHSELHGNKPEYHLDKLKKCQEKNIRLITIFEDEWLHHQEIVKYRLKNILGLNQYKIGARKLIIQRILPSIANKFCKLHHIQGVGKTVHAYGLYRDCELISVMTFSNLNPAKGLLPQAGIWELNRYCSVPDISIQGGASKLFRQFVKDVNPQQVISYSDRRWNTGNVYQQLGFGHLLDTRPNYWYIDFKSMARIHRYSLRKTINDDLQLTEWENRKAQGWNRIWDCGNTKWIWNNRNLVCL